jgi:putative acyl-CoA dehydrogenase
MEALLREVGNGGERAQKGFLPVSALLRDSNAAEAQSRRIVESIAIALQASLMLRHAGEHAADAYCASRLEGKGGRAFGTLAPGAPCKDILERQRLAL